jgi:hypothetical protein
MADPGLGARSVKGVSASFLTPLAGPRKKAARDGPTQNTFRSGVCTWDRHDLIGVGKKPFRPESNSSSIAAAGKIVTKCTRD